jgi:benzodiazapine receptor
MLSRNGTVQESTGIRMIQSHGRSNLRRDLVFAALAIGAVVAVSVLGQIATYPNLAPWYAGLAKPAFNPPNWVFAPVWTTLYALMAFALWRVLRLPPRTAGRALALRLFFLQLALNAAWSWMFFAAHSPLLGFVNIVPQLVLVLATLKVAAGIDKAAAWCLVPLASWVAYASVLNFSLLWLNG